MTITIAVINKSTLVSDADVALMAAACEFQIVKHVAPLSNRGAWHVKAFSATDELPSECVSIVIMDDPDQANALGYHMDGTTGACGRVFVRPILHWGGSVLSGPLSVSAVLSHEVCETFCDKSTNMWIDRMDGTLVALEVCDPVENDSYEVCVTRADGIVVPVSVSNFVLYSWFNAFAPAGTRFDYLGNVKEPLTMSSGGYVVVLDYMNGEVTEVFGSKEAQKLHKQKKPHGDGSRSLKRQGRQKKHSDNRNHDKHSKKN